MQMKDELILENLLKDTKVDLCEDILRSGISLRLQVTGRSMAPFLVGGEFLTIKKGPGSSLHIGDLIFFQNSGWFSPAPQDSQKTIQGRHACFSDKGRCPAGYG